MNALPTLIDHAPGDATGLMLPAHGAALLAGGAEWLTHAFRTFGALPADNAVVTLVSLTPCPGGSTGAKFFAEVAYARPAPDLPAHLFIKFSRDFTDALRDDPGRFEMASEARFMPLTRLPGFPVAVPQVMFADYHQASGTGLTITERIGYGEGAIEPHREKCMDHATLAEPLDYYRTIVAALALLCAADRSGALASDIDARFPFDPVSGSADRIGYDAAGLEAALADGRAFAAEAPQMLPADLCEPAFLARLAAGAQAMREGETAVRRFLSADMRLIALCHWNAHIDNCWFERGADGALSCGLIDWGRVGRITFGSVLWGALSAADPAIWERHLPHLLEVFTAEYAAHGGPLVSPAELERHLALHMAAMGTARVLAFPAIIRFRCPGIAALPSPRDPKLLAIPPARNCLHIYTNWLRFWQTRNMAELVGEIAAT